MPKAQWTQTTRGQARTNPVKRVSSKDATLQDGANTKTKAASKEKPADKPAAPEDTPSETVAAKESASKSGATKKTASKPAAKKSSTKKAAGKTAGSTAKSSSKESRTAQPVESYLLLVRNELTDNPSITRVLYVPAHFTFAKLHKVFQIAFGWAQCHQHAFNVHERKNDENSPGAQRAPLLFSLIHKSNIDSTPDDDDIPEKDEATITLKDVYFANGTYQPRRSVFYEYDHGDGWEHSIVFLGTAPPGFHAAMHVPDFVSAFCVSGEGHACAEDCGGGGGWEDLKDAFRKPKRKGGAERREWYKTACANGDPEGLDPYKWDIMDVNEDLHEEFKGK